MALWDHGACAEGSSTAGSTVRAVPAEQLIWGSPTGAFWRHCRCFGAIAAIPAIADCLLQVRRTVRSIDDVRVVLSA